MLGRAGRGYAEVRGGKGWGRDGLLAPWLHPRRRRVVLGGVVSCGLLGCEGRRERAVRGCGLPCRLNDDAGEPCWLELELSSQAACGGAQGRSQP